MAVAVLLAGLAQAGHFHKLDARPHGEVHLQCLLCLHSAGSAGPPPAVRLVRAAITPRTCALPAAPALPGDAVVAAYHARGPPSA